MHRNERHQKQGDKLLKMPGKFDRGPVEFKSRQSGKEGEVMAVATREVVSVPPTTTILGAVEAMTTHGFRRLPVTDPGTQRLRGILTAGDIIDFMGGGTRFNLVQVKHRGNLIAALNESVREIMTTQLVTLPPTASLTDAVDLIVGKKTGGLPIINEDTVLSGIVTERDIMRAFCAERSTLKVEDIMTTSLHVTTPETPIAIVTREMVSHRFRRLPVVRDEVLFGIVTSTDIMKYIGGGRVFDRMVTGDVSDVMNLPVRTLINGSLHTTTPEKSINEVAREMLSKKVGALPVIEDSRLVGLVTEFDCVRAFAQR
ncbi:MAG: CBS domain-containing protein [Methanomicrobiales archaeon]|nr:CBS domain-containing protein [Methanomicrobiales archaeon]